MNRNIKRNKQQLEQVVDAVLKKMQLFQGDDAFLKNDFEEYCTPHMIDCLSKVWILQKLKVLKEIAIMCEDQSMQAAIDKIPLKIHDMPLSAIVDLFLTAVPVVNVNNVNLKQVKRAIFCSDLWETFEINNYDLTDIFDLLNVKMGNLTELFNSGELMDTYRKLMENSQTLLQGILSNVQDVQEQETEGEEHGIEASFESFEKELFSMIGQFCNAIEDAELTRTPFDSLEYINFSYDFDGYSSSYCWFEDEILKSAIFPKMKKKLRGHKENWCLKLAKQINQISGICNSWYLSSKMVQGKEIWYFPAFVCDTLEDSSDFEAFLRNWDTDMMCRIMALSMLFRYLEKLGGFKKRKLPRQPRH